jgi:glycosyltransferase involved in cell wall biosynthesis
MTPRATSMRVLLLAYNFPPFGGGGVQRPLKFARYLPEFGYDVSVITGPGLTVNRWSPADETLRSETEKVDIHRVAGPEPMLTSWQALGEKLLGVSSPWSRWWREGTLRAGEAVEGQVDVILATVPPYQSAEAAALLSRRLGCPWVADLRDPWALDELMLYASGFHRRRDLRRMRSVLGSAAAVVATSRERAAQIRLHVPELHERPVVSIPNGFDRGDFDLAPPARRLDTFRIVHAGSLYTDFAQRQRWKLRRLLRGSAPGVDLRTFSLDHLVRAIDRVGERIPHGKEHIELVLVGVVGKTDRRLAERSGIAEIVGYVPHREAIAYMRSADLLFLPLYDVAPGMRAATVPGKTYEYLAAQKPILASVPEGDLRDLLLEAGTADVCAPGDVEAMSKAIEARLDSRGSPVSMVPQSLLDRFERRTLTGALASLLDDVTAAIRIPGTVFSI